MAEIDDLATYPTVDEGAGLPLIHHDSSHSGRHHKLYKIDKPPARGAFYLSAHNAAMLKLLQLAYKVLKNNAPFDPNWARPAPRPT